MLFKTFSKKRNSIKMNFTGNYPSINNDNNDNNDNNLEYFSIKKIILLTTNYTLFCANNLLEYFNNLNIETLLIVNNKLETYILNYLNENNTYLFLIGINHIENINNLNLSDKLINKIILYQIEQLNQNVFVYNQLSSNVIYIMEKCYALFDYSKVNINYYPEKLKENVKLLSPLIKCQENSENSENSENIELFSKQFVSNIINNAIENYEKNITILFIGTLNDRRTKILDALKVYNLSNNLNYNIVIVSNIFNDELVQLIKKSKIIINLHYFNNAILELFRIHDILSYNCKILSEIPGNYEEFELIEKYSKVISFFPVINDNLSNINKMYESIDENLKNNIDLDERKKFIHIINKENKYIFEKTSTIPYDIIYTSNITNGNIIIYAMHICNSKLSYNLFLNNLQNIDLSNITTVIIVYSIDKNCSEDIINNDYIKLEKILKIKIVSLKDIKNSYYDFGKYFIGYHYLKNNNILLDFLYLMNDSIIITDYLTDICMKINDNIPKFDFIGILGSFEQNYHYQSWWLIIKKNLLDYYFNNIKLIKINNFNDIKNLITINEVNLSNNIISNYKSYSIFNVNEKFKNNPFYYLYEELYKNKFYITKTKYLKMSKHPLFKNQLIKYQNVFF